MNILLFWLLLLFQQDPEVTPPVETPLLDTVQAAFSASTTTPLVGEPFILTITAETPLDIEIIEWGEIPENWKPFEVLSSSGIQQKHEDNKTIYQQQIEAVIWRVGEYSSPQLYIAYRILGDEQIYRVPVKNISFHVPSILETQDLNQLQPRPYKPPVSLFYIPLWVVFVGLSAFAILIWFIWRWWEKRRRQLMTMPVPSAYEQAIAILKNSPLPDSVPLSLRTYLTRQFDIPAHHMTSHEIIQVLQTTLDAKQRDMLWALLEHSDVLKYGGVYSSKNYDSLLETAKHWLKQMETTCDE